MVGVCRGEGDVQQNDFGSDWQVNLRIECAEPCAGTGHGHLQCSVPGTLCRRAEEVEQLPVESAADLPSPSPSTPLEQQKRMGPIEAVMLRQRQGWPPR